VAIKRALGFSIFTEADSLDELKTMIRDAVSCHFDAPDKPSVIRRVVGPKPRGTTWRSLRF
jgi:hypothetical protein